MDDKKDSSSASAMDLKSLFMTPLGNIMDTNVLTMESSKTVAEAIDMMQAKGVKVIHVTNKSEVVGIVSKSDILFKAATKNLPIKNTHLRQIMSSPVYALTADNTLKDALDYMDKYKIKQVVVTSSKLKNRVLGTVSRASLYEKVQTYSLSAVESFTDGSSVCIINPDAIKYVKEEDA